MLRVVRKSSHRRRARSAALAAVVLALFAFGWLADRAHSAFERHAWCDDHQRVEHHDSAAMSDDHADDCAPDEDHGPAIEALESDSAEHAACCVLLARTEESLALPNARIASTWILLGARLGRAPPSCTTPSSTIPLLLLAPKQSPPVI